MFRAPSPDTPFPDATPPDATSQNTSAPSTPSSIRHQFARYLASLLLSLSLTSMLTTAAFANDAADPEAAQRPAESTLTLETKIVTIEDGIQVEVDAGYLRVPESRKGPSDRVLSLPYYRLRTESASPALPIFLLAGGPGSSWIRRFENEENFDEIRFYQGFADVVLFDQRGGGTSLPEMSCSQRDKLPFDQPLSPDRVLPALIDMAKQCRDHWTAQGVDLSAFNTDENARDVDALRRELGYSRMNLIGGSYGSHLALHLMRRYPDTIDRVLLYGIEGLDHTWDDPTAKLATLGRIAAVAEASEQLAPSIPEGGLLGALTTVLERLEKEPVTVNVKHRGTEHEVLVDHWLVQRIADRQAGRRSRPNAWPEMILNMYRGDYSEVAMGALALRHLRLQDPMHYTMDCASGITRPRRKRYLSAPAGRVLGNPNFEYSALCNVWQVEDLGDEFRRALVSDIPALLIHGTWDTSTPIENARETVKTLSRGHLVEVEAGNHGALYNLYAHRPESRQWIRGFLTGTEVQLPDRVTLPPLEFTAPAEPKKEPRADSEAGSKAN